MSTWLLGCSGKFLGHAIWLLTCSEWLIGGPTFHCQTKIISMIKKIKKLFNHLHDLQFHEMHIASLFSHISVNYPILRSIVSLLFFYPHLLMPLFLTSVC